MTPAETPDFSPAELIRFVNARREKERDSLKCSAVLAYQHAGLIGTIFGSGKPGAVYEVFPFWTQEEVQAAEVEKYRQIMMKYVAAGGGGKR